MPRSRHKAAEEGCNVHRELSEYLEIKYSICILERTEDLFREVAGRCIPPCNERMKVNSVVKRF